MSDKKIMTEEDIIQEIYPFYDPMIAQKDVELCGEQVIELMQAYAKHVLENVIPDKKPNEFESDGISFNESVLGYNSCIDQIKENVKTIGIEIWNTD